LERQLDQLNTPIDVPINIGTSDLQRDIARTDTDFERLNSEVRETQSELRQLDSQADRTGDAMLRVGNRGVTAFTNLRGSFLGVAAAFIGFQGFQALTRGAFAAVQSASDLAESLSKTNVVFGEFSENVQDFARTGPESLGLSNQAALEATATFGNLFTALGLTQEAAADLSPDIVQLAADLASFNNISVDDAILALRSGLVGEVEPLRRFGIAINAAAVDAKALELGLAGASGEVTEAAKVQARYALILEQTSNAQGDFARTADGVANRQRTLAAGFQDLQAQIGVALLPAFESLIAAGPSLIALIEGLVPAVESASQSFTGFVDNITPLLEQTTKLTEGFGLFGDILTGLATPARETLEILGSLFGLGGGNLADDIREVGDTFGDLFDRIQDRSALIGLASDLEAGLGPAEAFTTRLRQVAEQNDLTTGTFEKLAATAGLSGDALIDALRGIRANADAFELDAQAVQFLNDELEELLFLQQEFQRRQPGGNQQAAVSTDPLALIDTLTGNITEAFGAIGFAADAANRAINAVEFAPLVEGALTGAQAFVDLADSSSAAAEAIKTEGEEIVESFTGFMDDLERELQQRTAFQDNLTLLRAMGLDDLAQTFQDIGLEAATALAEAVADPAAAAEAERLLEANAADQAAAYDVAFRAQLSALFAANPLIAPAVLDVTGIRLPEILFAPGDIGRAGEAGPTTVVNNTFVTAPNPTTDTQRITQSVSQVRTGGTVTGVG